MWDDNADDYHRNGIQIIADSGSCTSCQITNLQIYNNIFHGSWSTYNMGGPNQLNAPIFIDDQGSNRVTWQIFNNIFAMAPNDGGGVACSYGVCQSQTNGSSGNLFANNTLYQASGGGTCVRLDAQTSLKMENNIIDGCGYAFNNQNAGLTTPTIDNDLWYNTAGTPGSGWIYQGNGCGAGTGCGFSSWQSPGGFDVHGQNGNNPNLTGAYLLSSGSPGIGTGANLTSLGIAALNLGAPQTFGVGGTCGSGCLARPSTGAWDVGAYPFTGSSPPAPCTTIPPGWVNTGLSAIQNNLLGPLTCFGSSPWVFGDLAESPTAGNIAPAAIAEIPVLGPALSGTVSWTSGTNTVTTSVDLTGSVFRK